MDRMTGKGALLARFTYEGVPIVVINTHLLANYRADWRPARRAARDQQRQLAQLTDLVRRQPDNSLVLLAGDQRPTYRPFPGVLARYALPLDMVLVRMPAELHASVEAQLCLGEPVALVGGGHDYLSDHLGVQVTISWRRGLCAAS
ncbi:MAG: hypothetical protein HGA45_29590 [Chloroflexales bacterium]|nr:hypothetical protein [Chloroflexales bacterium]